MERAAVSVVLLVIALVVLLAFGLAARSGRCAMKSRYGLRFLALGYLARCSRSRSALVFISAFEDGIGAAWDAVTTPEAQHALWLTFVMVAIAVPLNTVFGVICALAIVRQRFRGAHR